MRTDGRVVRYSGWTELGRAEKQVVYRPGFDCRRECVHTRKGDHGWAGDEFWLEVRVPEMAIVLELVTCRLDGEWLLPKNRITTGTTCFHSSWRTAYAAEQLSPNDCDVLASGKCYLTDPQYRLSDTLWTVADTDMVWDRILDPEFELYLLHALVPAWGRLYNRLLDEVAKVEEETIVSGRVVEPC